MIEHINDQQEPFESPFFQRLRKIESGSSVTKGSLLSVGPARATLALASDGTDDDWHEQDPGYQISCRFLLLPTDSNILEL